MRANIKISNLFCGTLAALTCGLSVVAISTTADAASLTPVDLELSLIVDVSGSIDSTEFNLQKNGYVDAFANADLFDNFITRHGIFIFNTTDFQFLLFNFLTN